MKYKKKKVFIYKKQKGNLEGLQTLIQTGGIQKWIMMLVCIGF